MDGRIRIDIIENPMLAGIKPGLKTGPGGAAMWGRTIGAVKEHPLGSKAV